VSDRPDPVPFIRRETRIGHAPLAPELKLHLADKVLPLWQMTEAELAARNLPPPYWAFAWPGGQALARYVLDRPELARAKRVIDFGAGSGLTGIAAAKAGAASVLAVDIDDFAHAAIGLNAALNDVVVEITAEDLLVRPTDVDLILIGDMCYEKPLAEAVTAWARKSVVAGALVLLGDPGRNYKPADGLEELARYTVPTDLDLEDRTSRETIVWKVLA
jgi:predicted nicotinamide N-methyase